VRAGTKDTTGDEEERMTVQSLLHGIRARIAAPSRSPRAAVVVGRLLGAAFLICFATGVYSHFIQEPLPWMRFPTRPIWLYQVSQGIHITAGIACFPLLLGKLYVVFPELFQSPPVRSLPHFLERASIALFVSSSLVQLVIGLLNTYQWYALFPFPFRQTHFALSFVIIGSLAIHIGVKLPVIAQHWRATAPEPAAEAPSAVTVGGVTGRMTRWIDETPPAPPATSRRGFLLTIGAATAAVVVFTAGQSFRPLDRLNLLGPRKMGVGVQGLPVNTTAATAGVLDSAASSGWRMTVIGTERTVRITRAELLAMPQYEVDLPIACVEGWSQMARWRGPRLREVLARAGAPAGSFVTATSLQERGAYRTSTMEPEFADDPLTLVALELDGETLDIDHGYPARLIAPARPGVLQTKWLSRLEVLA
jgi:hypothetical protein